MILFSILIHSSISNADTSCLETTNKAEIQKIVSQLIDRHFPSLVNAWSEGRIIYKETKSQEYFFGTFPKLSDVLSFKDKKRFFLEISTHIYNCSPPQEALKAILIHELKHLEDYEQRGFFKFIGLASKLTYFKSRARYERQTDLYTMEEGYASGLKTYRNWIYSKLNKNELQTKQCYYFTPEEIDHWIKNKEYDDKGFVVKYCQSFIDKERRRRNLRR